MPHGMLGHPPQDAPGHCHLLQYVWALILIRSSASYRRSLALLVLLATLLLFAQWARAYAPTAAPLAGTPQVTSYSAEIFNAPGQVWAIAQDHRGLIYFGVSEGTVVEFDGAT